MSTLATPALSNYIAKQVINGQGVNFDEIIFCHIPDLSAENLAAHLNMPPSNQIVHRQAVSQVGFVNENAVVYSVTVGTEIGDFDFNYIALINRNLNLLGVAVYTNTIKKIKNKNSIQGNAFTRSILLEFANAKQITNITIPAQTWQIDFTARLSGIDEKIRLTNRDLYGRSIFFDDGFLLSRKTGNQFSIHAGTAYIEGVRAYMENAQDITLSLPCKVYLDVVHHGTVTGAYQTEIQFLKQEKEDYVDSAGHQHYVQVLADIASNGKVTDRRELNKKYIPTSAKSDATDSNSSDTVATSKAVKEVKELAESKQSKQTTLSGYGITDFQVKTGSDDVDNYKTDGHYYFASSQHLPDNNGAWHVEVVSGGQATAVRQIARKANDTKVKTRFFSGSKWTEWKDIGGDGVPLGAIVAFPKAITNPTGFLKCDGSTIDQRTYPDLYRTLSEKTQIEGDKKRLPNLTRSDVGMTAYFATDEIPEGWIAFDEIKQEVTQETYPELYKYLIEKYKRIDAVPLAEDRFIRNAGNNLTVGMTQLGSLIGADSTDGNGAFSPYVKAIKNTYQEIVDQVGFDPLLTEEIGNGRTAVNNEHSPDGGQPETKKQY
ncbi:phage tail-collar fiber domain-containing protein, partial [Histophilus somni]|uniref:phage tail-collar fiber domain-containing protein n=1 Tax=Histophilus somni TaxID=731 RepID=UPI00094ADEEA